MLDVLFHLFQSYLLRQGFSVKLGTHLGAACSWPLSTGVTDTCLHAWVFHMDIGEFIPVLIANINSQIMYYLLNLSISTEG